MVPLIVQVVATLVSRLFLGWKDAVRVGLAIMFLFTAASHFSPLKHDLAAMIPPPFTGALWIIYITGVFEVVGAVGLLTRWCRPAAWLLIALLVGMFPANVYAALQDVPLRGSDPTPLLPRTLLQIWWIAWLYWGALRPRRGTITSP